MNVRGIVQLSLDLWGLMFCLMALMCMVGRNGPERALGQALRELLGIAVCSQLCDALAWGFRGVNTPQGVFFTRVSNFGVFFSQAAMLVFAFEYLCALLHSRGITVKKLWHRLTYGIGGTVLLLLMANMFTEWLYAFDAQNRYYRTGGYPILIVLGLLGSGTMIAVLQQYSKYLSDGEWLAMTLLLLLPLVATGAQLFLYGISLSAFVNTVAILLLFVRHQVDEATRMVQQERSLQEARTRLLQAQMQPHFLFNSLTTIRALIRSDPDEAYYAVTEFSGYLRGLLKALNGQEKWTIVEELRTVEKYLLLEKRRFGDALRLEFSTENTDFMIPVLCLQPLVENAVKHGIRQKEGGGTVRVEGYPVEDGYMLLVKDDGAGFDVNNPPPAQGEGNHIGVENVRTRIQLLGGWMKIDSAVGVGTTVQMFLPKEEESAEEKKRKGRLHSEIYIGR